ncbi:hypothetical protein Tco_0701700 [Tanacetum coccineum]
MLPVSSKCSRVWLQAQGLGMHDLLNSQISAADACHSGDAPQSLHYKLMTLMPCIPSGHVVVRGHHHPSVLETWSPSVLQNSIRLYGPISGSWLFSQQSNITLSNPYNQAGSYGAIALICLMVALVCGGRIRRAKKDGGNGGIGASSSAGTKSLGCSGSGMYTGTWSSGHAREKR